ncbi:MAG: cryptochrome/photolyase family protein, partial [Maribacter sp.]|nr:cryptochrome/photolyase family protein [Maribacter sp.]
CLNTLDYFCKQLLPHFGDYQDAMHDDEKFLFHSRLSFAMNSKILSPKEVIQAVLDHFYDKTTNINISQVEGFIRQIVGWREYMRGIYWKEMPEYKQLNSLKNTNKLPDFFWSGKTKMNCLKKAIGQSLDVAYAHHIQRLMVIGNFSLLTQIDPDEVDKWYLGVYIDAIEWVEITNTRGMSQFADGGIVATKPYVSSANYINKMSTYCGNCHYSHAQKIGEKACPFNSLYWNFLAEKKEHFKDNQRMNMMMALLDKMDGNKLAEIQERAALIIKIPDDF